jgi:rhodanese-related sulfurtransferase
VPLVVCHSGMRSHRAAQFLKQADFATVYSLAGGTQGWHEAGLPVVTGDTAQTDLRVTEIVGLH